MELAAAAAPPSAAPTESLAADEADLLQLLYLCPVALIKLTAAGSILLMNPFGAQLLMPIAREGELSNLFELFDPFAPEVGEMARRFLGRVGKVCEEHRVAFPQRAPNDRISIVSITIQKVDSDTFVAVLTDVTSAASRELFVRQSEERLHAVLDGLQDYSVCTIDTKGIITSWNRAAERLDDYRSDETIGRNIDMLVSRVGGHKSPLAKHVELARVNGSNHFEAWRVRKDGHRYWASISIAALYDKDDVSLLGFSIIASDLTEQRRAEDRLRLLAEIDPLTGAFNRRSFFENAKRERVRATESLSPDAMLLLDVDHFKLVNDTHGHDAGDLALKRVVEDCRKEIRSRDILGRFGGEEFAIFFPGCAVEAARTAAERIRLRIASPTEPGVVPCTVSIGVAVSQATSETVEELLHRADVAMYEAKANGRNCVRVAD